MILFAGGCSSSNGSAPSGDKEYAAAVSFGSVCCGTVSEDFLKAFVKKYNQDRNAKISADLAAGCGKEGEFSILFKLDKQNSDHMEFVVQLEKLVRDVDAKNKAGNSSSGTLEVKNNVKASEFEFCRLGIKPWL